MDYPYVPVVRSASLAGYLDLAQTVGLDAQTMLRHAGLSTRSLEDPETPLSTASVRALLEDSARTSGVEDFGLRMASRRQLSNLGPISLVLKEEPTARAALDTLCRYLRLLNASLLTRLEEHGDLLVIREDMLVEQSVSMRQSMELAVGVMFRILRELLGTNWKPVRVCFIHRPPQDSKAYKAFFGTTVEFNSEFNGIVCSAQDLSKPMPGNNPEMARFARQYLERALSGHHQTTKTTVRQLISVLLPGGRCTSQQVAQHLGVDRRTVHRHLASERESFGSLLQSVRAELVIRQIQDSDLPLAEVALLLGFAAPAAFSHWFRSTFGCSVTQWKKQQPSASQGIP
jgi:AraC-like DNA-binding protein